MAEPAGDAAGPCHRLAPPNESEAPASLREEFPMKILMSGTGVIGGRT